MRIRGCVYAVRLVNNPCLRPTNSTAITFASSSAPSMSSFDVSGTTDRVETPACLSRSAICPSRGAICAARV